MVLRSGLCFFLLFLTKSLLALEASVAYTVFYRADKDAAGKMAPYVEASWQVNPHTVHFAPNPQNKLVARMRTDIYFTNRAGIVAEDHFVLQTPPRATPEELQGLNIIGLKRYGLVPGSIQVRFMLTDLADSNNKVTYTDSFTVSPLSPTAFFSNLQLLDTVLDIPEQTDFSKNGRQQIPMPTNFLDDHKRQLHYYAELYGTDKIAKDDLPLVQRVFITKYENEAPTGKNIKIDTIKPASKIIVSGSLPMGAILSGNYYLQATLENSSHKIIANKSYFFQRLNTHPPKEEEPAVAREKVNDTGMERVVVIDLNKTFVDKFNLAQVRAVLKMLIPISTEADVATINGFLNKPDETYMRYYIYNRFAAQNKKDPAAAWKNFADGIRAVNKKFSETGVAGYETERGFTYLRYGAPTEVITVPNEKGALPYEIWQYNQLKQRNGKEIANALFLFYKRDQMMAPYQMLHSTVTGEMVNPSWRTYLYNTPEGGSNGNPRAEQYFLNR
jgi:GWxTD domain-containing protein